LTAVEDAVAEGLSAESVLGLLAGLDEDAVDMAKVSWMTGVVAGSAYEHLRLALTAPEDICIPWNGTGRRREDRRAHYLASMSSPCPECGGRGFYVRRQPTLKLAGD